MKIKYADYHTPNIPLLFVKNPGKAYMGHGKHTSEVMPHHGSIATSQLAQQKRNSLRMHCCWLIPLKIRNLSVQHCYLYGIPRAVFKSNILSFEGCHENNVLKTETVTEQQKLPVHGLGAKPRSN